MVTRLLHPDEYDRESIDSTSDIFELDDTDFESQSLTKTPILRQRTILPKSLSTFIPPRVRRLLSRHGGHISRSRLSRHRGQCIPRALSRRLCLIFQVILCILIVLFLFAAILRPSYTRLPSHYEALRARALGSGESGRANPSKEKVFIAISLYDKGGHLVNGAWGQSVLNLINLLGEDNVFLSIYENDGGAEAERALNDFESKLRCNHELVFEEHLPLEKLPKITMPDGSQRIKRIVYLAEVRNRALRPLDQPSDVIYNKVLYLNDVYFDPIDAAQLLFSTHTDQHGKTDYLAVCAVDFINAFKFYDTYASRDLEGYSMGVPFFPFFSSAGNGQSRQDILNEKDAVRVRSCWGGMVAFDARYLQAIAPEAVENLSNSNETQSSRSFGSDLITPRSVSMPIRFRAEPDIFYDACECCLINADLQRAAGRSNADGDTGIYQNPFIRVAYDPNTLWWARVTRRFERLYTFPHYLVNTLARMPAFNQYRTVDEGQTVTEKVWVPDGNLKGNGSFQELERPGRNGAFCGVRKMQLLVETPRLGDKNWEQVGIPVGG
ncbi:hypothetical protein MMC24_006573 [Lignoscripta atroalba]|nr:hypothetical protein [Lignoscripta atroalba]